MLCCALELRALSCALSLVTVRVGQLLKLFRTRQFYVFSMNLSHAWDSQSSVSAGGRSIKTAPAGAPMVWYA
jgi:hypothetical protein